MSGLDRDARLWADRIARAYAAAAREPVTPDSEEELARDLHTPVADCIGLALPSAAWSGEYVDPALVRWEAATRRKPGPRLARVDYGDGTVTMGW